MAKRKIRYQSYNIFDDIKNEVATKSQQVFGMSGDIATRQVSKDYYTILQDLPNPDPVLKDLGQDIEVYEQLRYDSRVGAVVQSRKSAVLSQKWEVIGPRAEFHKQYFDKFKMYNIMDEILDSVLFGYQISEVIWHRVGNYIVPKDLIGKPQRWFKFDIDNELRFLTKADMVTGMLVPKNKFIVATNQSTYDNPYGVPVLSSVFWPVSFRKNGYKWWLMFIEKYAIPWISAKAPMGAKAAEIAAVVDMLANMVQDAVSCVPNEYEINVLEASKQSSSSSFKMFMDFCNLEIAMSILGTNLTTEISGGSYAASQSHMEVRFDLTEQDTRIVENAMDTLITYVDIMNFGDQDDVATFNIFREEDIDKSLAERDKILTDQGVNFTSDYYKRSYGLRDADFSLKSKSPEGQLGLTGPGIPQEAVQPEMSF